MPTIWSPAPLPIVNDPDRRGNIAASAGVSAYFAAAGTVGKAVDARRVSGPYRAAMSGHFDPERETWTERAMNRVRR